MIILLNIVLTWKIIRVLEISVIYINIYRWYKMIIYIFLRTIWYDDMICIVLYCIGKCNNADKINWKKKPDEIVHPNLTENQLP